MQPYTIKNRAVICYTSNYFNYSLILKINNVLLSRPGVVAGVGVAAVPPGAQPAGGLADALHLVAADPRIHPVASDHWQALRPKIFTLRYSHINVFNI